MDPTALVRVAESVGRGLGTVAGAAVSVVIAWTFLKVVFSGSDRALFQAGRTLLVIGVAMGVLTHPAEVYGAVLVLGTALVGMAVDLVKSAVASA